jgi:F-type H+-transporting ATPase subunit delta
MASRGKSAGAARRYAEAAYQLATRDDALDAYAEGLEVASQLLSDDRVLSVLLLAKRVPEPVRKLADLLVQRGRIDQIGAVSAEYRRLLNRERGIVEAVATSALPLGEDEIAALREKVAGMTGRTVDLRVGVDEALIGGLTVRVGDTLYDASVRGRLERLRQRLVAGAR